MEGQRRPGDLILDRYMPGASAEAREEARQTLRALVRALMRVNRRLVDEEDNVDWQKSENDSIL